MSFKKAVGWIQTDKSRGTCFLVAEDLVLTALHVIADLGESVREKTPAWNTGTIDVYLDVQGEQARHHSTARPGDGYWGIADDWVLLALDTPVRSIRPLRLTRAASFKSEWLTYGFPSFHPHGMAVSGHVADPAGHFKFTNDADTAEAMQLYCVQSSPGLPMDIGGFSGAPCVAGTGDESESVYGLIRGPQSLTLEFQPGGVLWACPAGKILDVCGELFPGEASGGLQVKSAIETLREAHGERNLILVLGPGASKLPSTSMLLDGLLADAQGYGISQETLSSITRYIKDRDYARAMGLLKSELAQMVTQCIEASVRSAVVPAASGAQALIHELAHLQDGLKAVITTNLDSDLAQAFGWRQRWTSGQYPANLERQKRFVLHLCGEFDTSTTWVLSHDEYQQLYHNAALWHALSAMSRTHTLLYVGWDLGAEPTTGYGKSLTQLFDKLRQTTGPKHHHFALYPRGSVSAQRRSDLRGGGLYCVPHDGALGKLLERIAQDPGWPTGHTAELPTFDALAMEYGNAEVVPIAASSPSVAPASSATPRPRRDSTPIRPVPVPASSATSTRPVPMPTTTPSPTPGSGPPDQENKGVALPEPPSRPRAPWLIMFAAAGVVGIAIAVLLGWFLVKRWSHTTPPGIDAGLVQPFDAGETVPIDARPPTPLWAIQVILPAMESKDSQTAVAGLLEQMFGDSLEESLIASNTAIIDEPTARSETSPDWVETSNAKPSQKVTVLETGETRLPLKSFASLLKPPGFDTSRRLVILFWPSDAEDGWWNPLPPQLASKKVNRGFDLYIFSARPSLTLSKAAQKLRPVETYYLERDALPTQAKQLRERMVASDPDRCLEERQAVACIVQAENGTVLPDEILTNVIEPICGKDEDSLQPRACAVLVAPDSTDDKAKGRLTIGCRGGVLTACDRLRALDADQGTVPWISAYKKTCDRGALDACQKLDDFLGKNKPWTDWMMQLFARNKSCDLTNQDCDRQKILQKAVTVTVSVLDEPQRPFPSRSRSLYAYMRFRQKLLTESLTESLRQCGVKHFARPGASYDGAEIRMEVGFRDYEIYVTSLPSTGSLHDCVVDVIGKTEAAAWTYDEGNYSWSATLSVRYELIRRRLETAPMKYVNGSPPRPVRKLMEHLGKTVKYDWQERMARCWSKLPAGSTPSSTTIDVSYEQISHEEWDPGCWQLTIDSVRSGNEQPVNTCITNAMEYEALDYCERTEGSSSTDGSFSLQLEPEDR